MSENEYLRGGHGILHANRFFDDQVLVDCAAGKHNIVLGGGDRPASVIKIQQALVDLDKSNTMPVDGVFGSSPRGLSRLINNPRGSCRPIRSSMPNHGRPRRRFALDLFLAKAKESFRPTSPSVTPLAAASTSPTASRRVR